MPALAELFTLTNEFGNCLSLGLFFFFAKCSLCRKMLQMQLEDFSGICFYVIYKYFCVISIVWESHKLGSMLRKKLNSFCNHHFQKHWNVRTLAMWKTVIQYCSWTAGHSNKNRSYFMRSCDQDLKWRFVSFQIQTPLTQIVKLQILSSEVHTTRCVLWNRESKSMVSVLRQFLAEVYRWPPMIISAYM